MYKHLLADLIDVDAELLRDADGLMGLLQHSLLSAGFHIVGRAEHRFAEGGEGFTGCFILSESHAILHTYPEHGYLAFDLFSCGSADPYEVLEQMKRETKATQIAFHDLTRRHAPRASRTSWR